MARRFDHDDHSSRPGHYSSSYSQPSSSAYRGYSSSQSAQSSRNDYDSARAPRSYDHSRRRNPSLCAFVEDEHESLKREHNPHLSGPISRDDEATQNRGEVDQVPIVIDVGENPERRYIFIPQTTTEPTADATSSGTRTPTGPGSHVGGASNAPSNTSWTASTITPPASTITDTASTIDSNGSSSTPIASASNSFGRSRTSPRTERPADSSNEYEANTCRKFTVPRIDAESTISEPSTIGSDAGDRDGKPHASHPSVSGIGKAFAAAAVAAAGTAAAVGVADSQRSSSRTEPAMTRRKSRLDLPRLDTNLEDSDSRSSASSRAKSATRTDGRGRERQQYERSSRDRVGERSDYKDNDFLSPAHAKQPASSRDRQYYDQSHRPYSTVGTGQRGRTDEFRTSYNDVRTHDGSDKATLTVDEGSQRRRSASFSAAVSDTSGLARAPSGRRPLRDGTANSRPGRRSPSPPSRSCASPSPPRRGDRRPASPPRNNRDRDRDRERDRERYGYDTNLDPPKPSHRDSAQMMRRNSIRRGDENYSSDERNKKNSGNTSLRRQNSERRRLVPKDDGSVISKASSNPGPQRPPSAVDSNAYNRYRSEVTSPITATPRHSQVQMPFIVGSLPMDLFDGRPSSPTKTYRDERRRRDDRRAASPPSVSSSPESRSRVGEGDRPRGPRPRAHMPNVVHNPTNTPVSAQQTRAPAMPIPIPNSAPIVIPSRGAGSLRERDNVWADRSERQERRRSPVDSSRSRPSQSGNPARMSSVFTANTPTSSQPSHQPAFFINLPSVAAEDPRLVNLQSEPLERKADRQQAQRQTDAPAATGKAPEKVDSSLMPIYRRHEEDVYYGRLKGLPHCPRQDPSNKYRDWHTLKPFKSFLVCPTCFDAAFANTQYQKEFTTATIMDPSRRVRCVFGSVHWYRAAYFYAKTFQMPNLRLLKDFYLKDDKLEQGCAGPHRVTGRWFTLQDPVSAQPVSKFAMCELCMTAIEVLFPRLKGLFQDNDTSPHDTTNVCAMYFEPDRKRLWKYMDVLETANNTSVAEGKPVDVDKLINNLLDACKFDECKRDLPIRGRKWYWMRSNPAFTVCQECFEEAVYPLVDAYHSVAGDFFKKPKELPIGSCHLYSPRMRGVFLTACKNGDRDYLEEKLRERNRIAARITDRIERAVRSSPMSDAEQQSYMAEWQRWE